jgi:DNA-binding response OmpR family regulator
MDAASRPEPTSAVVTGSPRVLVIDDDPNLADVVRRYLEREGFAVEVAADGRVGLDRAVASLPDLIVLDLMLPGMHGIEVLRSLRRVAPIPVVMLTARGSEEDRVTGLELGADDYLSKPFSPRELVARVRSVLRRAGGGVSSVGATVLTVGDLEVDLVAHEARRGGERIEVTAKEFDLLAHFMAHPGRAFTREELLESVWGYRIGDTATVTVHVRRLRERIEVDASNPQLLETVRGVGYRFVGAPT